jgi:cell wall-associated NlpC family hydrolase
VRGREIRNPKFEIFERLRAACLIRISDFGFRIFFLLFLAGCAAPPPYVYTYIPGRTAVLSGGYAIAPPAAPPDVQVAVAAANRISGMPYVYGAGHSSEDFDSGYDCSGAASFVLKAAGLLDSSMPSNAFRRYGEDGPGDWITIYARRDHVFLVIAGLRFDTGWTGGSRGPRWTTRSRPTDGCVLRHPGEL